MSIRVNPKWFNKVMENFDLYGKLDETVNFTAAAHALIMELDRRSIPFKLCNLGAGVRRITVDVETCPCCKRKLK